MLANWKLSGFANHLGEKWIICLRTFIWLKKTNHMFEESESVGWRTWSIWLEQIFVFVNPLVGNNEDPHSSGCNIFPIFLCLQFSLSRLEGLEAKQMRVDSWSSKCLKCLGRHCCTSPMCPWMGPSWAFNRHIIAIIYPYITIYGNNMAIYGYILL